MLEGPRCTDADIEGASEVVGTGSGISHPVESCLNERTGVTVFIGGRNGW